MSEGRNLTWKCTLFQKEAAQKNDTGSQSISPRCLLLISSMNISASNSDCAMYSMDSQTGKYWSLKPRFGSQKMIYENADLSLKKWRHPALNIVSTLKKRKYFAVDDLKYRKHGICVSLQIKTLTLLTFDPINRWRRCITEHQAKIEQYLKVSQQFVIRYWLSEDKQLKVHI